MIKIGSSINDRERLALLIGALCILIYLFYALVYRPLHTAVLDNRNQLKEKKETLAWMQTINKLPLRHSPPQAVSSSKLLTIMANELSRPPLKAFPVRLQQTSQGDIQLTFDSVPYLAFLKWLWLFNQHYTIGLKQVLIVKSNTPGLVNVSSIITIS